MELLNEAIFERAKDLNVLFHSKGDLVLGSPHFVDRMRGRWVADDLSPYTKYPAKAKNSLIDVMLDNRNSIKAKVKGKSTSFAVRMVLPVDIKLDENNTKREYIEYSMSFSYGALYFRDSSKREQFLNLKNNIHTKEDWQAVDDFVMPYLSSDLKNIYGKKYKATTKVFVIETFVSSIVNAKSYPLTFTKNLPQDRVFTKELKPIEVGIFYWDKIVKRARNLPDMKDLIKSQFGK